MTMKSDADLLKDLAGAVEPLPIDEQTTEGAGKDPLEIKEPVAPSPVKSMDAKHSTKVGGKGFAVTVRGEYYAPADVAGKKVKRPYSVTVNLPHLTGALSLIKNHLLLPAIKAKHPEALGFHTHEIEKAVPLSPETSESSNIQYMSMDRLRRYVEDHNVPVEVADYSDVVDLRSAVVDYTLNPKGFEEREKLRQAERKQKAELAALNPGLVAPAN